MKKVIRHRDSICGFWRSFAANRTAGGSPLIQASSSSSKEATTSWVSSLKGSSILGEWTNRMTLPAMT